MTGQIKGKLLSSFDIYNLYIETMASLVMNKCLVIEWILECLINIGVHHPYGYCTK